MKFTVKELEEYTVVHFDLEDALNPQALESINPPKVNATKGVVLSGRGPIWFYCYLAHYYHPTKFIATYDPRLGGVVVESHNPKYKVGQILKVDLE